MTPDPATPADCYDIVRPIAAAFARGCHALDADDLAADAMLRLVAKWPAFNPADYESRRQWAYVVARNAVRDTARRRPAHVAGVETFDPFPDGRPTCPARTAAGREELALALAAVAALPEPFRAALLLRVAGLTAAEAGGVTGVPAGTARWRVFKARQLLGGALA